MTTGGARPLGRGVWWIAAAFFVVVALYGAGPALVASMRNAAPAALQVGAPAPDFQLTTFSGEPSSLAAARGEVAVLNLWASWCGPCKEEAPALERLWQAYRDRGVRFIGVAVNDTDADARAFVKSFGLTYPNGLDSAGVGRAYRITGVPETFLIDRDGRLAKRIVGPVQESALAADLDRLLGR